MAFQSNAFQSNAFQISIGNAVVTPNSGGYEYELWNPHYLVRRKFLDRQEAEQIPEDIPEPVVEAIEEVAKLELPKQESEIALRLRLKNEYRAAYLDIQNELKEAIRLDIARSLQELRQEQLAYRLAFIQENNRRVAILMALN
jgi:hypothetical protein